MAVKGLRSSWSLPVVYLVEVLQLGLFSVTTQHEINFQGELVMRLTGVTTPVLDFHLSFGPCFLSGRFVFIELE